MGDILVGETSLCGVSSNKSLTEIAREVGYDMPDSSVGSWQAVADAVVAEYEARRWRPISEAHEDFGLCLFVNMLDPGMYCAGTTLDGNWGEMAEECEWTHFCQIVLTTETVERLIALIPAPPKEGE